MANPKVLPDTFKAYEDGKSRRYSLLFSVNGGAFAIASLLLTPSTFLGRLTLPKLSLGMIAFTVLLTLDIFLFGQHMRSTVSKQSINGDMLQIFEWPGKAILIFIGLLICLGWLLAAMSGSPRC